MSQRYFYFTFLLVAASEAFSIPDPGLHGQCEQRSSPYSTQISSPSVMALVARISALPSDFGTISPFGLQDGSAYCRGPPINLLLLFFLKNDFFASIDGNCPSRKAMMSPFLKFDLAFNLVPLLDEFISIIHPCFSFRRYKFTMFLRWILVLSFISGLNIWTYWAIHGWERGSTVSPVSFELQPSMNCNIIRSTSLLTWNDGVLKLHIDLLLNLRCWLST